MQKGKLQHLYLLNYDYDKITLKSNNLINLQESKWFFVLIFLARKLPLKVLITEQSLFQCARQQQVIKLFSRFSPMIAYLKNGSHKWRSKTITIIFMPAKANGGCRKIPSLSMLAYQLLLNKWRTSFLFCFSLSNTSVRNGRTQAASSAIFCWSFGRIIILLHFGL